MNKELINIIPTLPLIQNAEDINESTRIGQDLRLDVIYAHKFLFKYGDLFHVDISQFKFKKYFSKNTPVLSACSGLFKRKRILTLGELEQAIAYGKLNDEVLKDIREKAQEKKPHKRLYFQGQVRYSSSEIVIYILIGIVIFILLSIVTLLF